MTIPEWLPPVAAMLGVQILLLAFFAGSMRTELRLIKEQVDKLLASQSATQIAVLESRVEAHEAKFKHIDDRFEEAFRQIAALTRGTHARSMQQMTGGE